MTKKTMTQAQLLKLHIQRNLRALADPGDTAIEATPPENDAAEEAPDPSASDRKLKVLKDPDAHKLVMRIYTQFVSTNDLSDIVGFIQDFDTLLAKYRKGKPMTEDEIEKVEKEQNGGVAENNEGGEEGEAEDGEPDPEADVESGEEPTDPDDKIEEDDDEAEEPTVTVSGFGQALGSIMSAKRKG
jgi:hypothetical protein